VPQQAVGGSGDGDDAGGVVKDVTFVDADHDIDDQIDAAYRTKYRRYAASIVGHVVSPEARSATIYLVPRRPTGSRVNDLGDEREG
jgi:hypothetical protein